MNPSLCPLEEGTLCSRTKHQGNPDLFQQADATTENSDTLCKEAQQHLPHLNTHALIYRLFLTPHNADHT